MQKLNLLLKYIDFIKLIGNSDISVHSIEYNSKNVSQNSLFVAIKGDKFDGHQFIDEAIRKGATSIVCQDLPQNLIDNITYIQVLNSRIALAELANAFFDFPSNKLKVIGITGTNGKTTITFLLNSIFEYFHKKTAIIGTTGIYINNNKIPATHTTPESLELFGYLNQCVEQEIDYVSMEVSSHSLLQNRVHNVNFVAAAFTNLTQDHLDYHKTMQDYANAKKILFDNISPDAIVVINSDDKYSDYMISNTKAKNIIKVGRQAGADYIISNEHLSLAGLDFEIIHKNKSYKIKSKMLGKFNIDNLSQAFAIASELGINPDEIPLALKNAIGAPGRMEKYDLTNGAIAIIDYAHTPDALEKALQSLREVRLSSNTNGKIICVFGCGGNRDQAKRPMMGRIASNLAEYIIITNDNPRLENPEKIFENILDGIPSDKRDNVEVIPEREKAIKLAIEKSSKNDIILIAGKGHEEYQIIGTEKIAFRDKDIILKNCVLK
ncbi:MAG TPA: UDP-N-acetylmuramoyl-L-alanyl-D-glutamate--2,6-diaminopimelate ligase [Bacteroidetes bacterium]|nr:UDP-N-acetylmuramoyl-L-alanyl-D-glutamate--2,6-diaminopimelate ligase [Bacteroidota bacterium]